MSIVLPPITTTGFIGIEPARLVLRPLLRLDEQQFSQLVAQNPELPLEQNAQGEVIVMSPTGFRTGWRNNDISYQLTAWNRQHQRGTVCDSSTLFRLPNGAARSPDAAWVEKARYENLTIEEQDSVAEIAPNFVIELRSKTDRLVDLQAKLVEYLDNGVELGWIVDPLLSQVHIYEAGQPVQVLDHPTTVSGTGSVQGFVLDLKDIFKSAG